MADRMEEFLELSELLTGFGRFQLLGTGVAGSYLDALGAALPEGTAGELLDAFARLPGAPGREAGLRSEILADPKLGPVARNIIMMWYCGTWVAMPSAWRVAYGTSPLDTEHVVSAAAYEAGLQWLAAGAHPAGARQQGFGAWAAAPQAARERAPA